MQGLQSRLWCFYLILQQWRGSTALQMVEALNKEASGSRVWRPERLTFDNLCSLHTCSCLCCLPPVGLHSEDDETEEEKQDLYSGLPDGHQNHLCHGP